MPKQTVRFSRKDVETVCTTYSVTAEIEADTPEEAIRRIAENDYLETEYVETAIQQVDQEVLDTEETGPVIDPQCVTA